MAGYIGKGVAGVASVSERKKVFTATAGQTAFTPPDGYTVNNVDVFQNGVRLVDGTDYTATDGTTVTLTNGAQADDEVVIIAKGSYQNSDSYTKAEADAKFIEDDDIISVDDTNNRIGIGTTSPRSSLDIDGGSETQVRLQTNNTGTTASDGLLLSLDSSANAKGYLWNYENAELIFGTNNTEAARIDSSGKVGIGTNSPDRLLTLSTTDYAPLLVKHTDGGGAYVSFMDNATTDDTEVLAGAVGNNFVVHAGDVERMRIDSSGRVTMPYQPAAHVFNAPSGDDGLLGYQNVSFNNGNHWDTTNKRFVCPVDGIYQVTWHSMKYNYQRTGVSQETRCYKNGSPQNQARSYSYTSNSNYGNNSATLLVECSANDYLDIRVSGDGVYQAGYSCASFLLIG